VRKSWKEEKSARSEKRARTRRNDVKREKQRPPILMFHLD
jgi:hypothetical protein